MYRQFLDSLLMPIESFISWMGTISDYLFSNYIFITFFGLMIFSFIFSFGFNLLSKVKIKKNNSDKYN